MQTFLPYDDFQQTAKVLDWKRLGKQRVEACQILKALHQGPWHCWACHQPVTHFNPYKTGYHCYHCEAPLKRTAWYNHPAVKMWKGYERGLLLYLRYMCDEWKARGYQDSRWEEAQKFGYTLTEATPLPDFIGDKEFHLSHQSNLLRKKPEHYGQFFMGIPSDLPYKWPVK